MFGWLNGKALKNGLIKLRILIIRYLMISEIAS